MNILIDADYNKLSYDLFTWSDNTRAQPPDCIVNMQLLKEVLEELSKLIWIKYMEVREEVPSYFKEWNEPFPESEREIVDNPLRLEDYFKKSSLWSEYIIETLSELQEWDSGNSKYHLLKLESASLNENIPYLNFYAIELK